MTQVRFSVNNVKGELMIVAQEMKVKVTRIASRWHCRLLLRGKVIDEYACQLRIDIGWCCRDMLRWANKMGHQDPLAIAGRERKNRKDDAHPKGKVWTRILNRM